MGAMKAGPVTQSWRVRKYIHTLDRLGLVVREERAALGLSVTELATAAGVSVELVERLEAGLAPEDYRGTRHVLEILGVQPLALPHAVLAGA
jgi:transcriptional regulator with XRE-family HTH domain